MSGDSGWYWAVPLEAQENGEPCRPFPTFVLDASDWTSRNGRRFMLGPRLIPPFAGGATSLPTRHDGPVALLSIFRDMLASGSWDKLTMRRVVEVAHAYANPIPRRAK
jgi:hypothetical protein